MPTWRNGRRDGVRMIVYGPYTRKDGRKHVILYDPRTQKRTTVSYPKYLMEKHLERKLTADEEVDHIDNDYTNDSFENLQVLTKEEHRKKTNLHREKRELMYFDCPICNSTFQVEARDYRHNQVKRGKAGPFCSRSCAGIHNTGIQYNKV